MTGRASRRAPSITPIDRVRVAARLAERFERRITLVTAPAGYGKSTALHAAIDANALSPDGLDLWIDTAAHGTSRLGLATAVAGAAGADSVSDLEAAVAALNEWVWSRAPQQVAVFLDDAHTIDDAAELIRSLLAGLPANGSLVVASRTWLDLGVARLRAQGDVVELGSSELELDDSELAALHDAREQTVDLAQLPRHPATADLQLVAGSAAGAEFVWQEILSRIEADRLHHLAYVGVLEHVDDELVATMTDGAFDAPTLFAGIPLITETSAGRYSLHSILRDALTTTLEPGEHRKALAVAADAERRRHRLARAAALFDEAGDEISAIECARLLALRPLMSSSAHDAATARRIVSRVQPGSHLDLLFDSLRHLDGNEADAVGAFDRAADAAAKAGDDDAEALCRHRAAQLMLMQHDRSYRVQTQRLDELAVHNELARAAANYYRSIEAQLAGDGAAARAALDDLSGFDLLGPLHSLQVRAERLSDLGQPEAVIAGLDEVDREHLPAGVDQWIGMAMLQCAAASPEQIMPLSVSTADSIDRRGFSHPACFSISVAVTMALACGDRPTAERLVRRGVHHAEGGVGAAGRAAVAYARAALLLDEGREDEALAVASVVPDGAARWPGRAEIWGLCLAYLLRPERRSVLDDAEVGASLAIGRDAARAVVEAREGDPGAAERLPWERVDLLRIQVPPILLVELALAARNAPGAADVLTAIPDHRRLLQRLASLDHPASEAAREVVDSVPAFQPFTVRVSLLGRPTVTRHHDESADAATSTDDLSRRPKAAELLALLVERRRLDRFEVISKVWAGHDDERKALASLRTTLNTLNDVLEPGRERGKGAFHLRTDGELLELDERVESDVDEFERLIDTARADDTAGAPRRALSGYLSALDLYAGELLHGIDASWVELQRVRLRSLATGAMCRVAELQAASGEPEQAARHAERALRLDPLHERAIRCLASALAATGDRAAARRVLSTALGQLADEAIEPEPATTRLADRLS